MANLAFMSTTSTELASTELAEQNHRLVALVTELRYDLQRAREATMSESTPNITRKYKGIVMAKGVACTLLHAQVWFAVSFDTVADTYEFTVEAGGERFLPVGFVREPVEKAP